MNPWRLMITLFLQEKRMLSKDDTNEKEKKEKFATEANEDEVQHKKKIEDEAKKIEDEAQRELQRKRNSKLMRQMQDARGEQWLEENRRQLPDSYFQEVTYCTISTNEPFFLYVIDR